MRIQQFVFGLDPVVGMKLVLVLYAYLIVALWMINMVQKLFETIFYFCRP